MATWLCGYCACLYSSVQAKHDLFKHEKPKFTNPFAEASNDYQNIANDNKMLTKEMLAKLYLQTSRPSLDNLYKSHELCCDITTG